MTLDSGEEPGKLFVGGLSWETTVEKLSEYFCRFGEVIDCVVMKNAETGRSRGFGFVTFKDPNCVQLVLSSGPHQLDNRTIDPKACNAKSAQKGKREAKMSNYPKIFLGGLPPNVNETVLREYFSKYGKVIEVVIMYDQEKKKTRGNGFRGFGFLSFESEEAVNKVVAEHYVTINGKKVEVKRAEPRDKPSSGKIGSIQPSIQQQQPPNQIGGPVGSWWAPQPGPPVPGPPPPGPPCPVPGAVPNGMPPAGYPPSWGGPPQPPYGPNGGWSGPPGYQGYPGWTAGYAAYPQGWANQQGYPYGSGYPANYPGYGQPAPAAPTPMSGAPAPPSAPTGGVGNASYGSQNPLVAPPPPPPTPAAPITSPLPQTPLQSSTNPASQAAQQGSYAQDASSYGPVGRVYGYGANGCYSGSSYPGPGVEPPSPGAAGGAYCGANGAPQPLSSYNRNGAGSQVQFHPYRRV